MESTIMAVKRLYALLENGEITLEQLFELEDAVKDLLVQVILRRHEGQSDPCRKPLRTPPPSC